MHRQSVPGGYSQKDAKRPDNHDPQTGVVACPRLLLATSHDSKNLEFQAMPATSNQTRSDLPLIVDDKTIAELIGMSLHWVRKDRITKRLLPFFRVGGSVRYDVPTVRKALLARSEGGAL